ncbi:MAG: terpene cyclase/mutase family protein [Pirellulales bacterium]|nr:terpene cyclase/mutase family protein [Pirellulales bacterium]
MFPSAAETPRGRAEEPLFSQAQFMTTEATAAIDRGLAYLAGQQTADGSFGTSGNARNVAVVALGGMAFLAAGSTPGRGPYGKNIDGCIDYLLANTARTGLIAGPDGATRGPMYGHGFAALFLAEVHGMSERPQLRDKLGSAVDLIISAQNRQGGWRYTPQPRDADLSVTVCQVMALRAARNAGVAVPRETIDRSVDYVRRCQNEDGGFRYMIAEGPPVSGFARTAAGLVALNNAGVYEGGEIERGLAYLMRFPPQRQDFESQAYYFYGQYYAVQAMWHAGGAPWRAWYPAIRDQLVARQSEDGSWLDAVGKEYGTAMACIILQTPNNYLPILQR